MNVNSLARISALESGVYGFTTMMNATPEQIFEYPEKEKTRQFIRRLKKSDLEITPEHADVSDLIPAGLTGQGWFDKITKV